MSKWIQFTLLCILWISTIGLLLYAYSKDGLYVLQGYNTDHPAGLLYVSFTVSLAYSISFLVSTWFSHAKYERYIKEQ